MIVQGHQQVSDMLKRGERIVAAEGLDHAVDDRRDGHDIVTIYPTEGAFAIPSPTSIIKGSPNPNAAKAFAAFMISDTLQTCSRPGALRPRIDIAPPKGSPALGDLKLMPIDYDYIEKETAKIKTRFNEIFQ